MVKYQEATVMWMPLTRLFPAGIAYYYVARLAYVQCMVFVPLVEIGKFQYSLVVFINMKLSSADYILPRTVAKGKIWSK